VISLDDEGAVFLHVYPFVAHCAEHCSMIRLFALIRDFRTLIIVVFFSAMLVCSGWFSPFLCLFALMAVIPLTPAAFTWVVRSLLVIGLAIFVVGIVWTFIVHVTFLAILAWPKLLLTWFLLITLLELIFVATIFFSVAVFLTVVTKDLLISWLTLLALRLRSAHSFVFSHLSNSSMY